MKILKFAVTLSSFLLLCSIPTLSASAGNAHQGITSDHNSAHMSCEQIAHEVVELDRTIREARDKKNSSDRAGTGVSVARTVGSLLVGSLGGVVGIVAVGALAGEAAEEAGEEAAATEEQAEERQNRLAGVFEGKGCEGELALTQEIEDVAELEPASGEQSAPRQPRYND